MPDAENKTDIVAQLWKPALAVGGVAAIGAFVFWSLYKDWLKLDIFSRMSADQTFHIMIVFLLLVFIAAITLVISWVYLKKKASH